MSLVANYCSSDDEGTAAAAATSPKPISSAIKSKKAPGLVGIHAASESGNGGKRKIKITLDNLQDASISDDEESLKPRLKAGMVTKDLFSMLPEPKTASTLAKTSSFVEADRRESSAPDSAPNFFNLGVELTEKPRQSAPVYTNRLAARLASKASSAKISQPTRTRQSIITPSELSNAAPDIAIAPTAFDVYDPANYEIAQRLQSSAADQQPLDIQLPKEAIEQLIGRRKRKYAESVTGSTASAIDAPHIIDASAEEQRRLQYEAQLRMPQKEPKKLPEELRPTQEQKKRSGIMALAFSAKMYEDELEEKWAIERRSKREAGAKYGF